MNQFKLFYFLLSILIPLISSGQYSPEKNYINQHLTSLKHKRISNNYIASDFVSSINNAEFKLDSFVTFDKFGNKNAIYNYTYDSLGLIKIRLEKKWINNSLFIKVNSYSYDSNSNLIQDFEEKWENETYLEPIKVTFKYDAFGNKTEYLMQIFWDGGWNYYEKEVYNYNVNGLLTSLSYWNYDHNLDIWSEVFNETFSYENGKLIQNIFETKNGETNKYSRKYTYDSNGNVLTTFDESFENGMWIPNNMFYYSYDASNNLINIQIKLNSSDTLQNYLKITFYYDNDNKLVSQFEQDWDDNNWKDLSKTDYFYYSENNLSKIEIDNFNFSGNERYFFTNYENGNYVTGKYERYIDNKWIADNSGDFDKFLEFLTSNGINFYFHSFVATWMNFGPVRIENCSPEKLHCIIYPNIATDQITIESNDIYNSTIQIFNSNGYKVMSEKGSKEKTEINIRNLIPGIYFVIFEGNHQNCFGKFIKH